MNGTNLTVQSLGPKGDGISLGERGRIFVERAVPGDYLKGKIQKDNDGINRAEITEILTPSPYRQKPPCVHYDHCGNCTVQHVTNNFYREWKLELVRDAFRKQGLRPRQWMPAVFLGNHNRRRATFTARKQGNKYVMGYFRRRSDQVTDIESCLIAEPKLLDLRNEIKPFLSSIVSGFESSDIFLQIVGDAVDMVISGPIGRKGVPDMFVKQAMETLLQRSSITRISWRSYEDDSVELLAKKGNVIASFGSLNVSLPPAAFMQPTVEGEKTLVNAVLAALPTKGKKQFADLFSGSGTFSGPMLSQGSVDAYEWIPPVVTSLSKAANSKKLPLRVFRRDLFQRPLRRDEINKYDAVVFDPPRAGCAEQAENMAASNCGTLIGVSCNPATFARDAAILCDGGYWLQSLQVVDQFMWSHHVEVVGVFTKQKRRS